MKSSLATIAAFIAGAEAVKQAGNMKQLFKSQLAQAQGSTDQSCEWTINSIKQQANLDVDAVLKQEGKWTDNRFGHDDSALRWNSKPDGSYNLFSYTGVSSSSLTWQRLWDHRSSGKLTNAAGKQISLWGSDGVHPNDIKQGRIGNCYLLAALASIAESTDRFEQVFKTKSLNS